MAIWSLELECVELKRSSVIYFSSLLEASGRGCIKESGIWRLNNPLRPNSISLQTTIIKDKSLKVKQDTSNWKQGQLQTHVWKSLGKTQILKLTWKQENILWLVHKTSSFHWSEQAPSLVSRVLTMATRLHSHHLHTITTDEMAPCSFELKLAHTPK